MDQDVNSLLSSWDLEEYIPKFAEHKISLSTFILLDSQLIKELIPAIGDRAKFTKNLAEWNNLTQSLQDDPDTSIGVDFLNESHRNVTITDITNTPSTSSDSPDVQSYFIATPVTNSAIPLNNDENIKINSTNLKDLLESTIEGRGLLKLYSTKGILSNNGRRKICNIIVKHLLEEDCLKRISSSTLMDYANQITEIFKGENISTYFVPYIYNSKLKIKRLAKGKLYDCLQNRKREFREACTTSKFNNDDDMPKLQTQDLDGVVDDINWLKNSCDPWTTVVDKWQKTAKVRLAEIQNIAENMNTYPVLKKPAGFYLLTNDFKSLYPDSFDKLTEEFPLYTNKILDLTIEKFARHPDSYVKEFTEELVKTRKEESSPEAITVYAFMSFPLLLGNPLGKNKKNTWRPSKLEMRDAFITHLKAASDLKGRISARKEKYANHGLTFQPTIFIIGPSIKEIINYYVVVDDTFYVVNSILEAVDVTFKIYQALHCEYPMECISVYTFLQKAFYKISTKWDKKFTCVNALLADIP